MIEHMYKVMTIKNERHKMAYGYILNKVFDHFKGECRRGLAGFVKQTINMTTMMEYDRVDEKVRTKSKSEVSKLITQ